VEDAADDNSSEDQNSDCDQDNLLEAHLDFSAFLRETGMALGFELLQADT
jgi:hypothetical protein